MTLKMGVDVPNLTIAINNLTAAQGRIDPIVDRLVTHIAIDMQRAVVDKCPYGVGMPHIKDTITHEVRNSGHGATARIFAAHIDPIRVASVENGARPHWPPISALVGWVTGKMGVPLADAWNVAFLVARGISIRGTKAHKMFAQGYDVALPLAEARVQAAIREIGDVL